MRASTNGERAATLTGAAHRTLQSAIPVSDADGELIASAGFGFIFADREGKVLSANGPACELLGHEPRELIGRAVGELVHPDDRGWGEAEFDLLLAGVSKRVRQHVRLLAADGSGRWCELDAHPAALREGRSVAVVVMIEDAGDAALRERELQRLADTDPLTELYNRRRFDLELERHLALAERYGARGSLLLVDIDQLKEINDVDGHRQGDRTIVKTADLLRATLRTTDTVARIGGDEFAVLLPNADAQTAATIAAALLQKAGAESADAHGRSLALSVGIADLREVHADPAEMIERADAAMYAVKAGGGCGYAIDGESAFHQERQAMQSGAAAPEAPPGRTGLRAVLETVAELGGASRGLVAWELDADEHAVSPAWSAALRDGLLERARFEEIDQEWQYSLTERGLLRLKALVTDARTQAAAPTQ